MKNSLSVSVIITTYNRRNFLADAIQSVVSQSRKAEEIIVIDDGSTDGSERIAQDFPVKYEWKKNGGISSARNLGIRLSSSDYIAFLDVDDLWKKEKLAVQTRTTEETNCVLNYTDEIWIRNGQHLNQKKRHEKFSGNIYEKCLPLCIISASSALIKRSLFDGVGLFDESLPVCEDYDMWLRVCSRHSVLFVPQPLIVKRGGHDDQLSRKYPAMDKYRIRSLLKILKSETLTVGQQTDTRKELRKRCVIIASGALKRGRMEEVDYYNSLAEDLEASNHLVQDASLCT